MINDPIDRRSALAALLAPLLAAGCSFDSILAPRKKFSLFSDETEVPMMTLIGSGCAHAKSTLGSTAKTGAMTASMLAKYPEARAFMTGDLVQNGRASEYADYHRAWGSFKERTDFQIGNKDLLVDPTGKLWYDYTQAGEPGKYYYAKTYGSWRVYQLDSQSGLWAQQNAWLAADLPLWSSTHHIIAMWHQPMFASVCLHNGVAMTRPGKLGAWWNLLQQHGAEFVCSSHVHRYERLAQLMRDGTPSSAGIRQFILGTGGPNPMAIKTVHPYNEANVVTRGITRFSLYADRYEWEFTDLAGVVRDSGAQPCRKVIV